MYKIYSFNTSQKDKSIYTKCWHKNISMSSLKILMVQDEPSIVSVLIPIDVKSILNTLTYNMTAFGTFHNKDVDLLEGNLTADIKYQLQKWITVLLDPLSSYKNTPKYMNLILIEIIRTMQQTFSFLITTTEPVQGSDDHLSSLPNLPESG